MIGDTDPDALLKSLRYEKDSVITNPFGERVWLKALITDGKQVGLTDCCLVDDPCNLHSGFLKGTPKHEEDRVKEENV